VYGNLDRKRIETKLDRLIALPVAKGTSDTRFGDVITITGTEGDTGLAIGWNTETDTFIEPDTAPYIDIADQCDDPTYRPTTDAGTIDWVVSYTPINYIQITDDYNTDITIDVGNNRWDVYQDSAGVHLKVFRKEVE